MWSDLISMSGTIGAERNRPSTPTLNWRFSSQAPAQAEAIATAHSRLAVCRLVLRLQADPRAWCFPMPSLRGAGAIAAIGRDCRHGGGMRPLSWSMRRLQYGDRKRKQHAAFRYAFRSSHLLSGFVGRSRASQGHTSHSWSTTYHNTHLLSGSPWSVKCGHTT